MTDQEIDELGDKFGWFNDDRQQCFEYKQFIAFARALLSSAIPEGHVVVPKEPTKPMVLAGETAWDAQLDVRLGAKYSREEFAAYPDESTHDLCARAAYRAMIAAAAPANKEGT